MQIISYACHVAYLHPLTGDGLLILPHVLDDVPPLAGGSTLHEADWNNAIADLRQQGWELAEGEDGGLMPVGQTDDGRFAISLCGREPVISTSSVEQSAAAWADLIEAARVVPERA